MDKIKGVFCDRGGTLRIVEKVPEHQERAKVRMARLAGREDVEAFINMVEARYEPYREWALGENREAGDYELWHQWLLPEMGEERLRPQSTFNRTLVELSDALPKEAFIHKYMD